MLLFFRLPIEVNFRSFHQTSMQTSQTYNHEASTDVQSVETEMANSRENDTLFQETYGLLGETDTHSTNDKHHVTCPRVRHRTGEVQIRRLLVISGQTLSRLVQPP